MDIKAGEWVRNGDALYRVKTPNYFKGWAEVLAITGDGLGISVVGQEALTPATPTEAELAEWDAALAACGLARLEGVK